MKRFVIAVTVLLVLCSSVFAATQQDADDAKAEAQAAKLEAMLAKADADAQRVTTIAWYNQAYSAANDDDLTNCESLNALSDLSLNYQMIQQGDTDYALGLMSLGWGDSEYDDGLIYYNLEMWEAAVACFNAATGYYDDAMSDFSNAECRYIVAEGMSRDIVTYVAQAKASSTCLECNRPDEECTGPGPGGGGPGS